MEKKNSLTIYCDGKAIWKFSDRNNYLNGVSLRNLPRSLARLFPEGGKYIAVQPGDLRADGVAKFRIKPAAGAWLVQSDFSMYPAQYVGGNNPFICKAFLKVLTGKTEIEKQQTVRVGIGRVRRAARRKQ